MRRIFALSVLVLSACSTGQYSSSKELTDGAVSGPPLAEEALAKELSRSFKPDDYSEVQATLITESLVRAHYAAIPTNDLLRAEDLKRMADLEVDARVKRHTCFKFAGLENLAFSIGHEYKPDEWQGFLLTGGGGEAHRLLFSPLTLEACTAEPISFQKSFAVLVKSQFRPLFGEGYGKMVWERKGDSLIYPEGLAPLYKEGFEKYLASAKSGKIHYLDEQRLKVIASAVQTRKLNYFVEQLPGSAPYSWEDHRIIAVLASGLAKAGGEKCYIPFVRHLLSLGPAELKEAHVQKYGEYETKKGYRCAPVAEQLYAWYPELRMDIENEMNNSLADNSADLLDASPAEVESYSASLATFQKIHKLISRRCLAGEKDQCIRAEFFEENLAGFRKMEKAITARAQKAKQWKDLLDQMKKLEKQQQKRQQQQKEYFI